MVKISKFNKRLGFYENEKYQTTSGTLKEREVLKFECWGAVKEQYASDIKATIGTILENSLVFMLRNSNPYEVSTKQTIKYNNTSYEIIKVIGDPLTHGDTTIYAKKKGL